MDFNAPDAELSDLIQRDEPADMLRVIPPRGIENNGRVNPVQRQLQHQQPQTNPFIINNNRTPNMPSNGGRKNKRTTKHGTKYKNKNYRNKNYKNKNRKHKTTRVKKV